jgi:hypothetical protein
MKSKLFLLVFVVAGVAWALLVSVFAAQRGFSFVPYLDAPWAGIAVGTFGGWMIGALGLRMHAKIAHEEALRRINEHTVRHMEIYSDPEPRQAGHREPYVERRKYD